MKSRIILFFASLVLVSVAIVARLVFIQILPNPALERLEKNQYNTVVQLPPQRGQILDRKGAELATSVTAFSLYADPSMVTLPRKLARRLAPLLEMSTKDVYNLLKTDRRFVWIKRQLESEVAAQIKGWNEPGLRFVEEGRRAYPNQALLSQVLGFVGTEGAGLEGLERKFDPELKGEKQSIPSKRDARGRPLVVSGQLFEIHGDGASVQTTIDKDLQYELEHELEKVTTNQMADKAIGIVMDPMTGEVLAMGSYPSFDPRRAGKANAELRRNRAVTDIFEPGSTFKVATIAAALRSGKVLPNTKFFCENGHFKIGTHTIHEAEAAHGFGWLSLAEILEVSSNIGTTKVAFSVGEDHFRQMISDMGFGMKTGIDFPGEASGILASGHWPDHLLSNISFGHGVGVTAIQMASVYSAIANGGKLMRPFLVKEVRDPEGRLLEDKKPEVRRQILTAKEASLLAMMLSGVTETGGTGTLARVDGYPVAGKTGTAQKVNPHGKGYLPHAYVASFIGFVPANNPQFTIYVVVDNPRRQFFGAQVAAPSFNHLASFALHQRGFMPIFLSDNSGPAIETPGWVNKRINGTIPNLADQNHVPSFSGLTVREVSQLLNQYNLAKESDVEFVGTGLAAAQFPPAGQAWPKKLRVLFKAQE